MINIDWILNIHQSYTQEQIKALNKGTLKNQQAQSQLINQIQKDDCVGCYAEPSNEYIYELRRPNLLVL